jgi:hypothetical protein
MTQFVPLIDRTSLSQTVNAANAVLFSGAALEKGARASLGRWIASRQGLPGAYADTFAGFPGERSKGIVTFTGERIASASARHILGEEASRLLRLLAPDDAATIAALQRADRGMQQRIDAAALDPRRDNPGLYCCGKCSIAFWRNLLSGGLDRQEERVRRGVAHLRAARDGEGGWRKFPFWYAALALSEMDFPAARAELKYAAPTIERTAERAPASSEYSKRRHTLATRVLAKL